MNPEKEKAPGEREQVLVNQEKALEWLDSYFKGISVKDSIKVFEINGVTYIAKIEKFVPEAEQLKQWADAAGIQLED